MNSRYTIVLTRMQQLMHDNAIKMESLLAKLRIWGLSEDETILLRNLVITAVSDVYSSEGIFDCLQRCNMMLARGDSFDDVLSWCENLPMEYETMLRIERIFPSAYPGGPGAKF